MANQISAFFEAQNPTSSAAAAEAVAAHLKLFWAPVMRRQFVESFEQGQAEGVTAIVAEALRVHREILLTSSAHLQKEGEETFPQGGGDAG